MSVLNLRRLLADARGTAVIEMAIVAPVLALGVIGVVDISNAYNKKLGLEQGAQRAIEKIMNTTETATVEATLANEVQCQVNGSTTTAGVTTCNTRPTQTITVTWRLDCTDGSGTITTQTTTDSSVYDAYACGVGTVREARYVQVGVTDKYTPMFPIHFSGFTSSDGTYHISATAGTRTS
jgi:Flp pilus assembly protein TadG